LDPAERVRKLQELLAVIPTDHLSRLKCLLPFLCQLEQHKACNDLSYEKIVDLFGITFVKKTLRVEEEGRKDRLALMDLVIQTLYLFYAFIFISYFYLLLVLVGIYDQTSRATLRL